jgi:2-oxoglutarate dehydrogenase E1 component
MNQMDAIAGLNIDSFLDGLKSGDGVYVAGLYDRWSEDHASVEPGWAALFAALSSGALPNAGLSRPSAQPAAAPALAEARAATLDSIRALMLIRAYRVRGHLEAQLDPLGLRVPKSHPELDPATYGFGPADMDRPIFIDHVLGRETASLREIVAILRETYCGPIGVEFMHIQDPDQKSWIQRRIEGAPWKTAYDAAAKREILTHLTEAEGFEVFCQRKFVGTKRFGLEGGESVIPAVQAAIETAAANGVAEIAIGMPHRGRLNTLVNVMKKPFSAVFSEFQGNASNPDDVQGSGDVKYHLGTSTDVEIGGRTVHLSLQPNPSHLEAVDPVVVGKIRAKQDMAGDRRGRRSAMAILMHGDAAFAGQGLVAETLAMSQLIGYRTGGTLHFVVNNQIGFTTVPVHAYSGLYCTDIAKSIQAPILHVNGDNPEAVVFCSRLLTEFRMQFGVDAVLDIVCYRRHGHNESDEPAFTQPLMYKAIRAQKTTRALYAEALAAEGSVTAGEAAAIQERFNAALEEAFEAGKTFKPNKADWLEGRWTGLAPGSGDDEAKDDATAVPLETLREVGLAISRVPDDFAVNPKIARQLEAKRTMIETGEGLDWATGEALAFGTLLLEGHYVRLSGEDCQRGTFSHRHAVLIDQESQAEYTPLNHIRPVNQPGGQATIEVFNSLLSEAGVLGFEYGYSLADPKALVLWEAQFGDFANGAQVIIDQFLASGETKWLRMSGLVMLLPHGFEGQGPEHSSARLERYLQLCAERNMQVCNFTTPANYFHALRRQLKRNFRKPLIVMTPKSLLRHKLAVSTLAEFGPGSGFQHVIPEADALGPDEAVRRVVLCSGKVYYDLLQARRDQGIKDVAIVRIEQLYPYPRKTIARIVAQYPKAELVWCQEEPENMGAWSFIDRRLEASLADAGRAGARPRYVGRREAASPATGFYKVHNAEQEALVAEALAA